MTLKWGAQRLKMGVWINVSNALAEKRQPGEKCKWLWTTPFR